MKPSFAKFIEFLHLNPEIEADRVLVDFLAESIFRRSMSDSFSAFDLATEYKKKTVASIQKILDGLVAADVIERTPIECPYCFTEQTLDEYAANEWTCTSCDHKLDLRSVVLYKAKSLTSPDDRDLIEDRAARERAQEAVRLAWKRQGFVFYFLTDLIGSEPKQEKDDLDYKEFLDVLRDIFITRILPVAKSPYFLFGEVGDLFKLIIVNKSDIFPIVSAFSFEVNRHHSFSRFRELYGDIRFKCMAGLIETDIRKLDELFTVTSAGSVDINLFSITKKYRLEAALKKHKESYYHREFDVAFWLFEERTAKIVCPERDLDLLALTDSDLGALFLFKAGKEIELAKTQ